MFSGAGEAPVIALVGASITVWTAAALGKIVCRWVGFVGEQTSWAERCVLNFGIGSACLSTVVFVMCCLHIARTETFALLAFSVLVGAWRGRTEPAALKEWTEILRWLWDWRNWPLLTVGVIYGGMYFVYALAPETQWDAVSYHLGLVREYINHHGFVGITTSIYAFLPLGTEMLYLFAYSFGLHSAAKLVHLALTAATVVALVGFTSRHGSRPTAFLAAVLYFCAPIVGMDSTTAYNDCALAFFCFLTFAVLVDWQRKQSQAGLLLIGCLAGFCFAIKYTGGLALVGAGTTILACSLRRRRELWPALRSLAWFSIAASVFVLPWVAKNLYITGNPFAPLFNDWFPNQYVTSVWEYSYREELRHFNGFGRGGWIDYVTAPLEVTIWGGLVQGILGPVFLLAPMALVAWRRPLVWALIATSILAASPWLSNAGVRFLIPALPFVAVAMAISLERFPRVVLPSVIVIGIVHAFLSWPSVITRWHPEWTWRLESPIPWEAALRLRPEAEYLASKLPAYVMAMKIDEIADPGERVLALNQLPEAYMDTEVLVAYQGALNERMFHALRLPVDQTLWPSQRLTVSLGVGERITGFRISPTNSHEQIEWALSEVVFYSDALPIQPTEDWRVKTSSRPWESRRIVDGDPIGGWYSGTAFHPDMSIEIHWDDPMKVSAIDIIYPLLQSAVKLEFSVRTATKEWALINGKTSLAEVSLDKSVLQSWTREELQRGGIDLLLVDTTGQGHNFIAPTITAEPEAWGLKEVFRERTLRLYRVMPEARMSEDQSPERADREYSEWRYRHATMHHEGR